jgi:hypothetical protein
MVSSILSPDQKVLETRSSTSPSTSSKSSCGSSFSCTTVKAFDVDDHNKNSGEGQEQEPEARMGEEVSVEDDVSSVVPIHESKDDRSRENHVGNNIKRSGEQQPETNREVEKKLPSKESSKETVHQSHDKSLSNDASRGNDFSYFPFTCFFWSCIFTGIKVSYQASSLLPSILLHFALTLT